MNKEMYDSLENLSNEYKEENSDLSVDEFRNDIMFKNMIAMEDCLLKAAIHEYLKSIRYYDTIADKKWYQPNPSLFTHPSHAEESVHDGDCWCYHCDIERRREGIIGLFDVRMNLCPDCGNKRCPKATDHHYECTGSNEAGQEGSRY